MRLKFTVLLLLLLLLNHSTTLFSQESSIEKLSGPYLGQKPPGLIPEKFAAGLLTSDDEIMINSVFSLAGDEFYYVIRQQDSERYDLMFSKIVNGFWSKPKQLHLVGKYSVADIALSPDGNRLYFCSDMPWDWPKAEGFDIWYVERSGDSWSKPINAGKNINSAGGETQPSFTSDGSMFFPSWNNNSDNSSVDLYLAKFSEGKFLKAKPLPDNVNSQHNEGNSFMAPDSSYILFARWGMPKNIDGGKALYISFKNLDGSWTNPKNTLSVLGIYGSLAALSHDGKYLFLSTPNGTHWMDVKILEKLR